MAEKKKKSFFTKIKDKLDRDKVVPGFQLKNTTRNSITRPKTKTNFTKKKIVKGLKNLGRGVIAGIKSPVGAPAKVIGKAIKSAISGGGSKAKATTPKIVPKKKPSPKIIPKKKPLSPAQKEKSTAVQKAEDARRAAGKKREAAKVAKKASDTKAADTRDAKRGGFITAKAAKTAGEKSNAKVAANKKRRTDELISRQRK